MTTDKKKHEEEEGDRRPAASTTATSSNSWFEVMIQPRLIWIFLSILPILWIVFVAVGWSKEDKVEDSVYKIWTRQRSDYNKDLDYVKEVMKSEDAIDQRLGVSSFAALAVSRDGSNLFTPERLEEIRTRMEETENTTVSTVGDHDLKDPATRLLHLCGRLLTYVSMFTVHSSRLED